jgi:hypothetical protein
MGGGRASSQLYVCEWRQQQLGVLSVLVLMAGLFAGVQDFVESGRMPASWWNPRRRVAEDHPFVGVRPDSDPDKPGDMVLNMTLAPDLGL